MKEAWRPQGSSDPLTYTCTCSSPGKVILFYRYFSSPPQLPPHLSHLASDPANLASFHRTLTSSLCLKGKIRVAEEGFNVTVGGSEEGIEKYMQECMQHWSFAGLESELDTAEKRDAFFKPTTGCACVFSSEGEGEEGANVRVCDEITPMGVSNYTPQDWDIVESLKPAEFHERLCGSGKENAVLVDVRNHYESRIGYFVDPRTGEPGLRPQIRRFGQWPQFVKSHFSSSLSTSTKSERPTIASLPEKKTEETDTGARDHEGRKGTQYFTYCTGGIRCEKGSRFLAENLSREGNRVCTLQGGIQAYLMWMEEEIKSGRKTAKESLFKGRNYVFDARGSTGLALPSSEMGAGKVAKCHMCEEPEDRLSKCRSKGCHLVLVVCGQCEGGDVRCCVSCAEVDGRTVEEVGRSRSRPICECEKERETKLWGDEGVVKRGRHEGMRKKQGKRRGIEIDGGSKISIQI